MSGATLRNIATCPATVPASPRATGPVRAASPSCRVLDSAADSSGSRPGRVLDARLGEQLHRLRDEGDEVVGAVREGGGR